MAGGILNPLTALVLLFIVVESYHFFPLATPTCGTFYFPIHRRVSEDSLNYWLFL